MLSWPLKFKDVFKICTSSMLNNGSDPYIVRNRAWYIKIFLERFIAFLCFSFLINSIVFYDIKAEKYTEAIKNGIMAIVAVTVTFKHSILVHRKESIKNLIEVLNADYETAKNFSEEEKEIILNCVKEGIKVSKFWWVAASSSALMFPVKAVSLMMYHCYQTECKLIPMFDLTYPPLINEYKDTPLIYSGAFLMCFTFAIFSMTVYIGFDPIVPICMLHTCGQLDLIGQHLKKALSQGTTDDKKENLKRINKKLIEIYGFVKEVQSIFVVLYEFNMKTTTILIPFSAFQIVESLRQKEITLEFIFFFLGALLHFYMPCYYSNLLMEKSEILRLNIYSCGWEMEPNIQIRKTILLMLTRTSVPLVIRTIFYPICLDTFAEMTRQAYGIYNLMNAAWS